MNLKTPLKRHVKPEMPFAHKGDTEQILMNMNNMNESTNYRRHKYFINQKFPRSSDRCHIISHCYILIPLF